MAEARAIVSAARQAGLIHAVVQNRRFLAAIRRIRSFVDSGAIGRLTAINCDFFLGPHFGGFREAMGHVLLIDMAIHTFDAARAMTGHEAQRVYCREWNPANSWFRGGASAVAIFDMSDGAVFTYRGSWCADGMMTSWEGAWRIVGERGTFCWDGFDHLNAEVVVEGERNGLFSKTAVAQVPPLQPESAVGGHLGVMRQFIGAVRGGPPPETAGSENLKSLAMVFGAIQSAETGLPVDIER
jgi:predicted dehydrogenase